MTAPVDARAGAHGPSGGGSAVAESSRNRRAEMTRYYAAACQTDLPCPRDRASIAARVGYLLGMVDRAALRAERARRRGHDLLSHLRADAYTELDARPTLRPGGPSS